MIASSPVQDSLNKTVNTAAYYASIFVLGLFAAILGPALPTLANNTSSTIDQISLLFVLGALGYLGVRLTGFPATGCYLLPLW